MRGAVSARFAIRTKLESLSSHVARSAETSTVLRVWACGWMVERAREYYVDVRMALRGIPRERRFC